MEVNKFFCREKDYYSINIILFVIINTFKIIIKNPYEIIFLPSK